MVTNSDKVERYPASQTLPKVNRALFIRRYSTASDLKTRMDRREISSVEVTRAAISRIKRYDGEINAICVRDFERAIGMALAADDARRNGETGSLLGVLMTIKESFNIAGLPTTWGIPRFKDFTPDEDAVAVARVKSAGAVILGITNVPLGLGDPQTYNSIHGTTNNPWDPTRTPGGSSGGSAGALAAGFGALSLGSDIAGFLRVPAHCCGVYAHKPSFGILPGRGHTVPISAPLGPIGASGQSASPNNLESFTTYRFSLTASIAC